MLPAPTLCVLCLGESLGETAALTTDPTTHLVLLSIGEGVLEGLTPTFLKSLTECTETGEYTTETIHQTTKRIE